MSLIPMTFHLFISLLGSYFLLNATGSAQPKTITILHTNDLHGAFIPHEAAWSNTDPKPLIGGFLELEWRIDSIRQKKSQVILLDGGDIMTGNPITDMEYRGAYGGALLDMMNNVGYDAWTIGNHDLDLSQDNLKGLINIASFPALSANLVDSAGKYHLNHHPAGIILRGGIRIGIVGIMSPDLFRLTNTKSLKGLRVLNPKGIMQRAVDSLDNMTDLLIALTHQGYTEDSLLAVNVTGIDVIVGAHSHTRLESPRLVNGVIIVQAGAYCENLGELQLTVNDDRVISYEGRLHQLWVCHESGSTPLRKILDKYSAKIDSEYDRIIGRAVLPMKRSRSEETIIGTYVAEAVRGAVAADIGIINSSGLRKDIPAGTVTKMNVYEMIPFRNYICTFNVNGSDLKEIIRDYIGSLKNKHTSLCFSNIRCRWEKQGNDYRIVSVFIGPDELKDDRLYRCATIDYIIDQAERYLGFIPKEVAVSETLFLDAVVGKIEHDRVIGNLSAPAFIEN